MIYAVLIGALFFAGDRVEYIEPLKFNDAAECSSVKAVNEAVLKERYPGVVNIHLRCVEYTPGQRV